MNENNPSPTTPDFPQHSLLRSLGLHVLPGAALGYVVWWKWDVRISVSLHVFANTLVRLMYLVTALAMRDQCQTLQRIEKETNGASGRAIRCFPNSL